MASGRHRRPFAETKEALAGFYLIDARDLNEAIQIASKIPPAKFGSIEVRPTRELGSTGSRAAAARRALTLTNTEPLMHSQIFVNLPVKDLKRSVRFLHEARLHFNPQFTDENATCMISATTCS
jgi:hypothetical protein